MTSGHLPPTIGSSKSRNEMHARHHRSLQVRVLAAEEAKAKQQVVQEAPVVEQ